MKDVTPEIGENLFWAIFNGMLAIVLLGFCVVMVFWNEQRTERMQTCIAAEMEWNGYCQKELDE